LRLQSSKRACLSIEVVPRPRGMRHNPPLERTAGGCILHLRSNDVRAPPRPLNGFTLALRLN
jgi:hypothetical protein